MESLPRSLNYELPRELQFDKYAQQILENSKTSNSLNELASTPTITTLEAVSSSEFLQKLGVTLFNSIQFQQKAHRSLSGGTGSSSISSSSSGSGTAPSSQMEMEFAPNHLIIDSSDFDAMDELQKQLEYDKFMNEVWIGIVLTLILISLVFCICSCFLYHQFRTWKRNYHSTVAQSQQAQDMEAAMKLQADFDDPVPEYTLVSGLPTYEAALELLHKTPQSCLIVYPSVFSIFNKNEKPTTTASAGVEQQQQQSTIVEVTTPLLSISQATQTVKAAQQAASIPSYDEAVSSMTNVNLTAAVVGEKVASPPPLHAKRALTALDAQSPQRLCGAHATTSAIANETLAYDVKVDKC